MEQITTVGIDLAKNIFQVHAVDAAGRVVLQKAFRRPQLTAFLQKLPPCLIGLEACSSAHHWGRLLIDATKPRDREEEFERKSIPGEMEVRLEDYLGKGA